MASVLYHWLFILLSLCHITDFVQCQVVPTTGVMRKSITLSPQQTLATGASCIVHHNEVYQSVNGGWGVFITSQSTWQFIVILDNTWGFDPLVKSAISITIASDYTSTGHGVETHNDLLFGFTVDNAEYIAAKIPLHNYNNGEMNAIYPQCARTFDPIKVFGRGDVASLPNSNRRCDVVGGDCRYWRDIRPVNTAQYNGYPMTWTFTNDPSTNRLTVDFESAWFSSHYAQNCTFNAFPGGQGFKMYMGGGDNGDTYIVDSFTVEALAFTAEPSNHPTKPPTNRPSRSPTRMPTGRPSVLPTQSPTDHPSFSPSNAPSYSPSNAPSVAPSHAPMGPPSPAPTASPSQPPTRAPTVSPTKAPTDSPTKTPTQAPTQPPTIAPTDSPTLITDPPTLAPTSSPTQPPSAAPTNPTVNPTKAPTSSPTNSPLTAYEVANQMWTMPAVSSQKTWLMVFLAPLVVCIVIVAILRGLMCYFGDNHRSHRNKKYSEAASHTLERDYDPNDYLSPKSRSITMSPSAKIARNGDIPIARLNGFYGQNGHSGRHRGPNMNDYEDHHHHHHNNNHNPHHHGNHHQAVNGQNGRQSSSRRPHRGSRSSRSQRRGNNGGNGGGGGVGGPSHVEHVPLTIPTVTNPNYGGNTNSRRDQISNGSDDIYEQYGGDINGGATDTASIAPSFAAGGRDRDGRRLPSRMSEVNTAFNGHRFKNSSKSSTGIAGMRDNDIIDADTIDALNGGNISPRRSKRRSQQVRYAKMSGSISGRSRSRSGSRRSGRSGRSRSRSNSKRRGTDLSEGGALSVTQNTNHIQQTVDIGTSSDDSDEEVGLAPTAFKWPHRRETTTAEYESFEEDSDEKLEMQPLDESVSIKSKSSMIGRSPNKPKRKRSSMHKGNPYRDISKRQFKKLQKAMAKAETDSDFEKLRYILSRGQVPERNWHGKGSEIDDSSVYSQSLSKYPRKKSSGPQMKVNDVSSLNGQELATRLKTLRRADKDRNVGGNAVRSHRVEMESSDEY